ncbi:serine hydrolase domain-containing protein [Spongiivirga citrea]|uniref:Serine hydrolase n=1 Tax=Spongiivirga citrea TaxID=1481457 RepID=A0A6M0CL43_9FLAO|nr:serine hydrolase domain-containing protein [Spongiivirga citrea]NER16724.1 serine hydrolase [Spongiivirga citrea]
MKRKFKIAIGLLATVLIGFITFVLYQTRDDIGATFENTESILTKLQKDTRNAGFAVSVFSKDTILFQKGFGYSDLESKTPYTTNTQQYIASVSKTTIGIALLKAQEMGLLNLDDPINRHLPFDVHNPNFPSDDISIRQLATHTSSLDYNEKVVESLYVHDSLKKPSLKEFVTNYFKNKSYGDITYTNRKPGTHFNYSNIGAGLAAYIVEHKSEMPFNAFTELYIFKPLGLKSTSWFINDSIKLSAQTTYYEPKNDSLLPIDTKGVVLYPARDLNTNIVDLTKYCQAIIARSTGLLTKESFSDLLSSQLDSRTEINTVDNSAIFWMIDRNQYGVTYQLTGMNGGDTCMKTMMWFDPKTELGYIFIGNTGPAQQNRASHILIFKTLVSLGDHYTYNNATSIKEKLSFKWHNAYSRINGLF